MNFVKHWLYNQMGIKCVNKQKEKTTLSEKTSMIKWVAVISVVVGLVGYYFLLSMVPVNVGYPVFSAPSNIFIKTIKMPDGTYAFATQSTKGGKATSMGALNPTYKVGEENLVTIYLINEIKNERNIVNKINLNIDEFNVHTGDMGYFQSTSITFLADKKGSFEYYDSYNPTMRGIINVQ